MQVLSLVIANGAPEFQGDSIGYFVPCVSNCMRADTIGVPSALGSAAYGLQQLLRIFGIIE
jgi:hypothetical protein